MADIWLIGSSAVTSDTFGSSGEESCATTLEGQGHTVTRRQASGVTAAPTTSDCDVVIHMDGTCGTDLAIRGTETDSAPVIACNTYYYANAYAHCALVSRTSTNGASGDTYEILSTTPGWTDGHVVTDTVLVWPYAVYQEELQTPASGGVAFVETTATGRVTGYLFETGTTNLASTATVTRMVCWNLFADLYRLNADGLQMLDDVIVWAIGAVDATATPSAVASTSTVPSPTASVSESRTASPSAVAATSSVLSPTASVIEDRTATPSAVAATSTVESPTASVIEDATASPATVAGTSTVESPTAGVTEDRTATPGVVAATSTVEAPSISTAGNATVNAAVVAASASVPSPTITVPAIVASPASVDVTAAVLAPSPAVVVDATATPAAVAATAAAPAPSLLALVLAAPASVDATGAVLAPSYVVSGTASPAVVALLASLTSPVVGDATPESSLVSAGAALSVSSPEPQTHAPTSAEPGTTVVTRS